jgi:hypothetical protein
MVLEAKQLRIELTWRDQIDPSDDRSEDRVVILVQSSKQVHDLFIVTEWSSRCRQFISIGTHLVVVVGHRELVLLCCGKGNSRVRRTDMQV